jgi:NAD+ diphosphatase
MIPPLGYATNPLVRHTAEHDPEAIGRAIADPATAQVLIAGDIPILRAGQPATSLLSGNEIARLPEHHEQVFLGTLGDRSVVGTLTAPEAVDLFRDDPAFIVADLRSVAMQGLVPVEELGILAMAKSMLDWHGRHRFCANCGGPTNLSQAGFRRDCATCGSQHFPRTDPVVIMMITRGDQCLLGRQARFVPGSYSCLAGFLEPGETIEDAVRRETFEEAGVRIGPVSYGMSQPWPFPSSIMIGCFGEALSEEIVMDRDELEDARWFSRAEVRLMLAKQHPDGLMVPPSVAIAYHLIRYWAEG